MHPYDVAADAAGLGIPGYVVADLKCLRHELILFHLMDGRCRDCVESGAEKASCRTSQSVIQVL
jgi:hypothetical protein